MSIEIERKFLVRSDDWRKLSTGRSEIRQAYLDMNPRVSVRVRIRDNSKATLTVKSSPAAMRRLELEYPIPTLEAEAMMPLRNGGVVEKTRHVVPQNAVDRELAWEIDEFSGANAGLVIAEIELPSEDYPVELPPWIGQEVTGQKQYYNGSLAMCPFGQWEPADGRERAQTQR
ncbi:MAG TPA: CYTH domain-containing protein [Xanthobacteraceae bacterium]|jgi:adenylate cyclase|nr:CYTH domain-containing protein [Xanthobacteraceae bacterium]